MQPLARCTRRRRKAPAALSPHRVGPHRHQCEPFRRSPHRGKRPARPSVGAGRKAVPCPPVTVTTASRSGSHSRRVIGFVQSAAHTAAQSSGVREWRYELRPVADEKICRQPCEPFRGCYPLRHGSQDSVETGFAAASPTATSLSSGPARSRTPRTGRPGRYGNRHPAAGRAPRLARGRPRRAHLHLVDGGQRGAESRPRHSTAPVPASSEDATDPPVGHLAQALGIGFRVLDVR